MIRAAVVLVLIARGAWAEPAPIANDPPAPTPAAAPAPAPEAQPAPKRVKFTITRPPAEMIRENSLLLEQARMARDAAHAGHCGVVLELSPQVRAVDPTFHGQLFLLDPQIAACLDPGASRRPAVRSRIVLRNVHAEPPVSFGRITGEIFLGMVVGGGGALVGALLGGGLCIGDQVCERSAIGGAYLGAILTIPLGVQAVGAIGEETGSAGMTYLGSALGGLGGLLMLANGRENISILGMVLAPPIGAMIGFNMTRRYRPRRVRVRTPVTAALVSWTDGAGASLGVPIPTRTRSVDRAVTSVPLLGGTF
jgi:hypothetical protein